ncbi:MAG TPA: ABC transporter ATP-binding protein, partial [Alphaproteobacteria bacterium]|nr:ABC transporter ATP-binding protein [Alphaproteobacteria bacterium]
MHASSLSLSFGTTVVYDNAEFNLSTRDKVGIVGVNGAGKTTLFKLILGELSPDAGRIDTGGA